MVLLNYKEKGGSEILSYFLYLRIFENAILQIIYKSMQICGEIYEYTINVYYDIRRKIYFDKSGQISFSRYFKLT